MKGDFTHHFFSFLYTVCLVTCHSDEDKCVTFVLPVVFVKCLKTYCLLSVRTQLLYLEIASSFCSL